MSANNKKIELKDIQVQNKNHLQDRSPRLIDIFMIAGYENIYINEQIIKYVNKVLDPKNLNNEEVNENISSLNDINQKGYGQYKCEVFPSILSSVTSDLESGEKEEDNYFYNIFGFQFYLEMCLCTTPYIYFATDKQKLPQELINPKDYIPTIITSESYNFCYSYLFYEEIKDNKITFYIPKLFIIVSKYQYYKTLHEICLDIYNIFKSPKVQIPLEVQIYNIVNLTPVPSDCRLQLCLFPYQDFNLQKLNSINFYNNAKFLMVDRLSGYPQNQINLGLIFNIFNVETVLEIFLELCLFTPIGFFSQDNEKLYFIISIFNTLMYPLLDEESSIIIPFDHFIDKELGQCIQNFYGILINENYYNELKKKFPKNLEGPNFYILLEEEEKTLISTFKKKAYDSPNDLKIDNLHKLLCKIIYEQESNESKIKTIIKNAKKKLNKINKEIKNKKICKNHYELNADENEINMKIRNVFYKLNLDISNFIYLYEMENGIGLKKVNSSSSSGNLPNVFIEIYNSNEQENIHPFSSNDLQIVEKVDDLFYHEIEGVHYKDILKNFCKSEDKDDTSKNFRLSRKIFASFLANLNSNPKENREIDYFRIIDSIYFQKEPYKSINFEFLEFYKYYFNNLDKYFSEITNSKYVTCTAEIIDKETKHFYTYQKIELDSELLMKYLCVLEQMDDDEDIKIIKDKMFKNEYLYVPQNKTKNLDILNAIEKYYIENNLLNYKEIIILCILNYIILTIPKKQLVYFNKGENYIEGKDNETKKYFNNFIYDLFDCIYLFKNKYIEMFLSTAYRFFNNFNEQNYYFIQPYLDIYDCCVVNRKLFKSEDIYDVYKRFKAFAEKIQRKYTPKIVEPDKKDLISYNSDKELYEFENELNGQDILNQGIDSKFDGKLIDKKIIMKYIYEPKTATCNAIYSPKKLYNMIKKIMKEFYVSLEIKDVDVDTMEEIGINLLYYCHLLINDNDLPLDTGKYILLHLNN